MNRRDAVFVLAIVGVTVAAATLLSHPRDGVFGHIQETAAWIHGGPKPEVVTWPAWGYGWLVAVLPSLGTLVLLQMSVGVLALVALAHKLRAQMPVFGTVLAGLFVLALPWHASQSDLYPSALAGSFGLLALLCLDSSLTKNSIRFGLLGGLLAGVSQNLRTEFVLLPVILGCAIVLLKRAKLLKIASLKPLVVFVVTAGALQVPWTLFYHEQTGRFSFAESNFGHVLYVSLGNDPQNPWGIKGDDQGAADAVREAGHTYSSLSDEGSRFLLQLAVKDIKSKPTAFAKSRIRQFKNMVAAPFNWGQPKLDKNSRLHLDVLREELKSQVGVGANARELQDYRSRGLTKAARRDVGALAALGYQFAGTAFGGLLLLFGIVGMILVAIRAELRLKGPLLWLLGFALIYKLLQDVLLNYQVNYLSNVFPFMLPFASVSIAKSGSYLRALGSKMRGMHHK